MGEPKDELPDAAPGRSSARVVSVVIPVYRGGPLVRRAVASVLNQSNPPLEVVVVSDGCTDDLTDLELLDPRLRVIRQANAGVSVARNVGIACTNGPLVAFLDEDDVAHPNRLEWQTAALASAPSAGVCHGMYEVIDGEGVILLPAMGGELQYRQMLELNFPLLSTLVVRRSVLEEIGGFDPALITGEDIEFFLRSGMRTEYAFVPRVVTSYRRHGSNTATGVWDVYPVLMKHRSWAEDNGRADLVAATDLGLRRNRRNASRAAFDDGRVAWRRRDMPGTVRALLVSLARDPTLVTGVAWSRITRRPAISPEGNLPT